MSTSLLRAALGLRISILPADDEQQRGTDERHDGHHHEDGRIRYMVDKLSREQRKQQAAQAAGYARKSCGAPCSVLRKEIRNSSKHVGRKKIVRHHSYANSEKSRGGIGEIRHSQTEETKRRAQVHGDAPDAVDPHSAPLQPAGCPSSG